MKEISVEELKLNPSTLIGKEWAFAHRQETRTASNTMTSKLGTDGRAVEQAHNGSLYPPSEIH